MHLDKIEWTSHSSGFKSCIIGDYKIWKHSDGKTYDIYHKAGLEIWDNLGPAGAQALLHKLSSQGWRRVADADQTQTAEEAKKIHIAKMGQPLGMSLLHIARLTDPAESGGKKNLTIQALPDLIADPDLKARVTTLVTEALKQTEFCRDWRNRLIAHNDLKLALEHPTEPVADASRTQVNTALDAVAKILNALAGHYYQSGTRFDLTPRHNGAFTMLYVLNQGVKARDERAKRLESGVLANEDLDTGDL